MVRPERQVRTEGAFLQGDSCEKWRSCFSARTGRNKKSDLDIFGMQNGHPDLCQRILSGISSIALRKSDGKAGLELAVYKDYDLILLDMCMPKYSGVDFILDLKHRRPSELSKVIIVSSLEMNPIQEQELLKLGIRSILRKPISVQNLLSKIEQEITF